MRGAHVLTLDSGLGDLPSGDVHVRNGAIVAVASRVPAPGAEVIDGRGMICMPGLIDTHWHHWTNVCRPFVRNDDPRLGYFPVTAKYGPHYQAGEFLPERPARPRRGAGRRYHHDAQLVPQHAQPGARRRRDPRHARAWHPRALRLWQSARRAEHRADGLGRSRPRQPRRAAGRRSGHARHLLPQHRRRFQSDARHGLDRNGKKGMERRARTGVANHAARFRSADHKTSRRRRAARS